MKISLVFAADENNGIGKDNGLPWPKMSADLKRFKNLTIGHHVIMGRKTHESMGGELPGRKNIIVSRSPSFALPPSMVVVESLADALHIAKEAGETEAFVIGGAMLFKEAAPLADTFYLTRIHHTFDVDTSLPMLSPEEWETTESIDYPADDKNPYPYSFLTLARRKQA